MAASRAEHRDEIGAFLQTPQVDEVLGAWGDLKHPTLRLASKDVLAMLQSIHVRVYYFGTLTEEGHRGHPDPRGADGDLSGPTFYLN
jgi:hypothetical protein